MLIQFSINATKLVSVCLSKLFYILGAELGGFRTGAELSCIFFGGGGTSSLRRDAMF